MHVFFIKKFNRRWCEKIVFQKILFGAKKLKSREYPDSSKSEYFTYFIALLSQFVENTNVLYGNLIFFSNACQEL